MATPAHTRGSVCFSFLCKTDNLPSLAQPVVEPTNLRELGAVIKEADELVKGPHPAAGTWVSVLPSEAHEQSEGTRCEGVSFGEARSPDIQRLCVLTGILVESF